jgi:hypothetical protein
MIKEEKLRLDEDIKLFPDELKRCFSKGEIEGIARETGFVKRKGYSQDTCKNRLYTGIYMQYMTLSYFIGIEIEVSIAFGTLSKSIT